MTEEKDEFEKWLWEQYHKDHYDKKEKDINQGVSYGIHLCINQYTYHVKPKLKAQILKENPLAGLSDEEIDDILELIEESCLRTKARYTRLDLKLKQELSRREKMKEAKQ